MNKSNTAPSPRYRVEKDQVWMDCDRRTRGRDSVVVQAGPVYTDLKPVGGTKIRRVRTDRMYKHSAGFELRKDFVEKATRLDAVVTTAQVPANSGGLLPAAEA